MSTPTQGKYASWEEEQGATFEAYKPGESVEFADGSEAGRCMECGSTYTKTVGEANVSKSGYCYRHGYNP